MAFFDLSLGGVVYRFAELIGAPFQNPNLLWFGLPLIITIIIIELNLGLGKKANYGLKQALPNAIILFFVFLNSAQVTFARDAPFVDNLLSMSFLATMLILLLSVVVFLIEYYKEFPKKQFMGLSAHLPINVLTYVFMVVVNNGMTFDFNAIFAYVFLVLLFGVLFFMVIRMDADTSGPKSRSSSIWDKGGYPAKKRHRSDDFGDTVADPFRGVKNK